MALLWMDGFESYGVAGSITADPIERKWQVVAGGSPTLVTGRTGGLAYQAGSSGAPLLLETSIIGDSATVIIGFGFRAPVLVNEDMIIVYDENGNEKMTLELNSDGSVNTSCAGFGHSFNETSAAGVITADTWHYIELKVVFNSSTGSTQVKVDGSDVINVSGEDTLASSTLLNWGYVRFTGPSPVTAANAFIYDDIYICDETGSRNNDILGDSKIIPIYPTGDDTVNFDRSSGTDGYSLIDEQTVSDSDYVEGDNGDIDLYTYGDISETGDIHGICIITTAKKTFTGHLQIENIVNSDVTTLNDDPIVIDPDLMDVCSIIEDDPNASAAWTQSTLNAAKFGFEAEIPEDAP